MNVENTLSAFLLFVACALTAQQSQFSYDWITADQGLPKRRIDRILQDSSGFIWLIREGLLRYDGRKFKSYNSLNTSPVKLMENSVIDVFQGEGDRIWITGHGHTQLLNPQTDSIEWATKPEEPVFHKFRKTSRHTWVLEGKEDRHYLLRLRKPVAFDTVYRFPKTLKVADIAISEAEDQLWLMDDERRLHRLDLLTKKLELLDSVSYKRIQGGGEARLETDATGRLWVIWPAGSGGDTVKYWEESSRKLRSPAFPGTNLKYLNKTNDSLAWFIERRSMALVALNLNTGILERSYPLDKDKTYYRILEDRQKALWLVSNFGVLRIRPPKEKPFTTYLTLAADRKRTSIRGMCELPARQVFITSYNGIYRLDPLREEITRLPVVQADNGAPVYQYYHLVYDSQRNGIWSGTEFHHNHFLDLATLTATKVPLDTAFGGGRALLRLDDDHLLIGGEERIERLHLPSRSFTSVNETGHFFRASCMIRMRSGRLFLGTHTGIYEMNDSGKVLNLFDTASDVYRLKSDYIYDLHEDQRGRLWAATTGGLHCLNFAEESITIYTTEDGLPDMRVCGILEDAGGQLWLSTFHGLSRFDPYQGKFWNYFVEDGIADNEFNHTSKAHLSGGMMIFGGINGITCFYPEQVAPPDENHFPLVLTNLATYSEGGTDLVHRSAHLKNLKQLEFGPGNQFFRLEFALLDYVKPQHHLYSWYLEGWESDWQPPTTQNFLQYNNIPAGSYTLHLKAASANGTWSAQQIAIGVTVERAFYQTVWFVLLCLSLLFFVIYTWYRHRLNQVLKIERMRNKIARDLHDDIGSALTRLSVQSQIIEAKTDHPDLVRNFSSVLLQTISSLRDVVWSIDSGHDKTDDLLSRMQDYAYDTLHPKNIAYQFHVQQLDPDRPLTPAFRQNVYLIFKESINNIVRHSGAQRVHITLNNQRDKKQFEMSIEDDGKNGLLKKSGGVGLKSMHLRAEELGGRVQVNAGEDGFSVVLTCLMK